MKQIYINNYFEVPYLGDFAASIGYFDGIHLGHMSLINKTKEIAKRKNIPSAIITFDPDPWTVIHDKAHVKHITPMKEKIKIVSELGIDYFIIIKFTKELSKLSPKDFMSMILVPLSVSDLIVGEDFKFGFKGSGTVATLELASANFATHVLKFKKDTDKKIGSTAITQSILKGDFNKTRKMLGRDYMISGYVKQGNRQGTKIGFPTANLDITDEFVIPKKGVYAGYVEVRGKCYPSVLNIGHNPTFNQSVQISIETHILNFNEIIYGELLRQYFVSFIREEIKFDNVEDLIKQMKQDVIDAQEILKEYEKF